MSAVLICKWTSHYDDDDDDDDDDDVMGTYTRLSRTVLSCI